MNPKTMAALAALSAVGPDRVTEAAPKLLRRGPKVNKYQPHQGAREKARRARRKAAG